MTLLLVRYGEIALKSSRIRKKFSAALVDNIENAFVKRGVDCLVREEWGRLFVETGDAQAAESILRDTFGIVSFSRVVQAPAAREEISAAALPMIAGKLEERAQTFAVRCRRKGSHGFSSQEMAAWVGSDILDAYGTDDLSVNLGAPMLTIEIEIRESKAYVFMDRIAGPGGFPMGTQGYVAGIVEEKDERSVEEMVLAFYLIMKRGCRVNPCFVFEEGGRSQLVQELLGQLERFDPRIRTDHVPGLIDREGRIDADLMPKGSALVSSRRLEDGVFKNSPVPVFYPMIALEAEVIDDYKARIFST